MLKRRHKLAKKDRTVERLNLMVRCDNGTIRATVTRFIINLVFLAYVFSISLNRSNIVFFSRVLRGMGVAGFMFT